MMLMAENSHNNEVYWKTLIGLSIQQHNEVINADNSLCVGRNVYLVTVITYWGICYFDFTKSVL